MNIKFEPIPEEIEINFEFDLEALKKLFLDYPELGKAMKHDGP